MMERIQEPRPIMSKRDLKRFVAMADGMLQLGDDDASAASACDLALGGFLSLYMRGHIAEAKGVMHVVLALMSRMGPDAGERAAIMMEAYDEMMRMEVPAPVPRREALRMHWATMFSRRLRVPTLMTRLIGFIENVDKLEEARKRLEKAGVLPVK